MTGRADAPMSEPTCGLWSTRMTLAPTSGKSALSRAGSSQAVSDAGESGAHHDGRGRGGRVSATGQIRKVLLQGHRAVVRVDVEAVLTQTVDVGFDHLAAERDHQAVVPWAPADVVTVCAVGSIAVTSAAMCATPTGSSTSRSARRQRVRSDS